MVMLVTVVSLLMEHAEKEPSGTKVTPAGILTTGLFRGHDGFHDTPLGHTIWRLPQFSQLAQSASDARLRRDFGMRSDANGAPAAPGFWNASLSMTSTPFPKLTDESLGHWKKAPVLIRTTKSGIVMDVRDEH